MSTRELRAERDRLAAPLAECPPDRSRELRLAAQRATEAERARQQARTDHQAASQQVAALAGSWRRRRELPAAKERRVLAEHTVATTTGQADQAAERLGVLRRVQQRHLGWMEAHDTELRVQERARSPGSLAGVAGPTSRRWCWTRRAGCWPNSAPCPPTRGSVGVARAAAELDGYRRAYGLDHPGPAEHVGGRVARVGRAAAPATAPTAGHADGTGGRRERRGRGERTHRRGDLGRRPTMADRGRRADPQRLLGAEPRRQAPRRRRDWQVARAALEHLAGWDRHRDHRDQRHPTANDPAAPSAATSASRNATAARAPWFPGSLTL